MKKIVRLTESDLVRIVKRVISEDGDPMHNYVVTERIYAPVQGFGGGSGFQAPDGSPVWLNSGGFSKWPAGDWEKARKSVIKLIKAIDGLDITGSGAQKMLEVEKEWKGFDLKTQNEFLKQWNKFTKERGWNTPWVEMDNDNESEISSRMIEDSENKVLRYCQPYADKINKTLGYKGPEGAICDSFIGFMPK